jgi:hypothetical protein
MSKIGTAIAALDIHHAQAALAAEGISASDDQVYAVLARLRGMPETELQGYARTNGSARLVVTRAEGSGLRAGGSASSIMSCLFRYLVDVSASSP